jgi:hypothetical protein
MKRQLLAFTIFLSALLINASAMAQSTAAILEFIDDLYF